MSLYRRLRIVGSIAVISTLMASYGRHLSTRQTAPEQPSTTPTSVSGILLTPRTGSSSLTSTQREVVRENIEPESSVTTTKGTPETIIDTEDILKKTTNDILSKLIASYDEEPSQEVGQAIVSTLIDYYRYDEARQRMRQMREDTNTMDWSLYLFLLLNTVPNTSDQRESVGRYIANLYETDTITTTEYHLYTGMIHLLADNITEFWNHINLIQEPGPYSQLIRDIQQTHTMVYADSPSYYQAALIANTMFTHGYIRVAYHMSDRIILSDSGYLLPRQVRAYSSFLLQNIRDANKQFDRLIKNDSNHKETYLLLQGILAYDHKEYSHASLLLGQVENPIAARYLLLTAITTKNTKQIVTQMEQIIERGTPTEHDFYTFFHHLFFDDIQLRPHELAPHQAAIVQIIRACAATLKEHEYPLCAYGQAGLLWARGNQQQAAHLLSPVASSFADLSLYDMLIDYHTSIATDRQQPSTMRTTASEHLKTYLMTAMRMSDTQDKQLVYRNLLVDVMLQTETK